MMVFTAVFSLSIMLFLLASNRDRFLGNGFLVPLETKRRMGLNEVAVGEVGPSL
jgi:hypothetical protein